MWVRCNNKMMEILKDLPTRNRDNFTKHCKTHAAKEYVRVQDETGGTAQAIVMETESLMLREFERDQQKKTTAKRKNSAQNSSDGNSRKIHRTDSCNDGASNDQLS